MPDEEMSVFVGVSRRDFLKFCSGIAVLIGLGPAGTTEVAAALESLAKRPSGPLLVVPAVHGLRDPAAAEPARRPSRT